MTSLSKPVAKKRGRPLGSKNKRKVAKKVAVKDSSFKQSDKDKLAIKVLIEEMVNEIKSQRIIISYLENRLESK